jgi:hypothetical protein
MTEDNYVIDLFSRKSFRNYNSQLIREYFDLLSDIDRGIYNSEQLTAGFEIEGSFLIKDTMEVPHRSRFPDGIFNTISKILLKQNNLEIGAEVGDYNFEINTKPRILTGDFFSVEEKKLIENFRAIEDVAQQNGLTVYLSGIVESVKKEDLKLDNLTSKEDKNLRYRGLNYGLMSFRGEDISINLDNFKYRCNSIMFESMCNSFQPHIKLKEPSEDFPKYMNSAMIISAPLIAISSSSPFIMNSGPFWNESRVPIVEQSLDCRNPVQRFFDIKRSFFPEKYYDSLKQFYTETLRYQSILPNLSYGKNSSGENMMDHPMFRLQLGTDWRWIRPVWHFSKNEDKSDYDEKESRFMTLEFRPLSSGPTILDMIANAALFYGAIYYFVQNELYAKFQESIKFSKIRKNFYLACKDGIRSKILWNSNGVIKKINILDVIQEITDMAKNGLEDLGILKSDSNAYLGEIQRRIQGRITVSTQKIELYNQIIARGYPRERAIIAVMKEFHDAFHNRIV